MRPCPDADTGRLNWEVGKQFVDKLVEVCLLDGSSTWILIHVEVQGQPEADFAKRMSDYNHRIGDRYGREVVSLAVLTDPVPSFRPSSYERRRWGFEHILRFPMVKLIDYEERRKELEESRNPFSIVVATHLDARKARTDGERFDLKFSLARRLYRRGYGRERVISLLRFLDWLVRLPKDLERVS